MRRTLELLRRAVEIAQQDHKQKTCGRQPLAPTLNASSSSRQLQQPSSTHKQQQATGGQPTSTTTTGPLVLRDHVTRAGQELFNKVHNQLLRGRSLYEKLLLVGLVLESRARTKLSVVLQVRGVVRDWVDIAMCACRQQCAVVAWLHAACASSRHCTACLLSLSDILFGMLGMNITSHGVHSLHF